MRRTAKAAWTAVVSISAVTILGAASVFSAAFAVGATALIVPGTGTPNPNLYPEYIDNARNYYLQDTACGLPGACLDLGEDLIGIEYPASFWPLTFIPGWCAADCQKWDASVQDGVDNLQTALAAQLAGSVQDIVVYGHSQGAAVVSNTLRELAASLSPEDKARIQIVMTGNVDNPAGGMWSRLGFLRYIPIIDLSLGLPTPTDSGINFTSIAMQYDGAANAPKYWGNLLAVANAVAGFAYLHDTTLIPEERKPIGVPDYYPSIEDYLAAVYDPANSKQDSYGNTYIVVPSPILPITMPFLDLAARTGTTAFVKPLVDLVSPVLRVLIDLGYDPYEQPGVYSYASILPFSLRTNPFEVAVDLAEAVVQGIHDAIHGGPTLSHPPTVIGAEGAAADVLPTAEPASPSRSAEVSSLKAWSGQDESASEHEAAVMDDTASDGDAVAEDATDAEATDADAHDEADQANSDREPVRQSADREDAESATDAGPDTDTRSGSGTAKDAPADRRSDDSERRSRDRSQAEKDAA